MRAGVPAPVNSRRDLLWEGVPGRRFSLFVPGKLWTANSLRRMQWMQRGERVREWRQQSWLVARQAKLPRLEVVLEIHVVPVQPKGRLADPGAHEPVVKAVVDGLVDAKVLPDDGPSYLRSLTYHAPRRRWGSWQESGVGLVIIEATEVAADA